MAGIHRLLTLRSARRQRGSVFAEFWVMFVQWLVIIGISAQTMISFNRQILINYYSWAAGRAYMAQPTSSKADDWVTYYKNYMNAWGIENRINTFLGDIDADSSIPRRPGQGNNGTGVLLTERYPQRLSGLVRLAPWMFDIPFFRQGPQDSRFEMNSWAHTVRPDDDEEAFDAAEWDNDCNDYDGLEGIASLANMAFGTFNALGDGDDAEGMMSDLMAMF